MNNELKDIFALIIAAAGGEDEQWCCLDGVGAVLYASVGLSSLLDIPSDNIKSLYQFNPMWSYLNWQEIYQSMDTETAVNEESKYLTSGEMFDCNITLTPFRQDSDVIVLYKILTNNNTETPQSKSEAHDQLDEVSTARETMAESVFSYDYNAPNPVIYFDAASDIVYSNKKMLLYNDPAKGGKTNVEALFLESELGHLVSGLENYPEKEAEILIRMILKSNKKMLDGFGRCSIHDDSAPGRFRLEFLFSEGMQLIDQPLEKAMAELDRIQGELSGTKSLLVEDQMSGFSFENIISRSPNYKAVLRQVAQVADTDTTVLITGETGTGKELLCNALYKLSDRSDELLVKVNCASIPHNLIESTLFGHEKGSFTGADSRKIGKFELADKGTIFLDEIGELPLDLQPKLLRVLQEGEIERIGNAKPIKIDVRVIAATNRDLEKLSKKGDFRSDLYYRLNVFPIYNIPLRDRAEDIPLLINHFLEKTNKKLGKSVTSLRSRDFSALKKYNFPGNVRELENIIMRSVILSKGEEANLDFFFRSDSGTSISGDKPFFSFEEMIKNHLQQALELANGKVTGEDSAAEMLGINGKTLASKLRKYDIDPKEYKN